MPIVADAAVAIRGDLSKFNKDLKGTDKQVQTLGQRLNNALNPKNLAGGLAAGFLGSQVVSFLGDATSAAAEFQDSVSATGIIFGDELVGEMEAWAESAHASFGASKQDALAAANVMATLAKSAGLAGQDVVNFSQEMVQLGGDLASMFGGTTQDAITAVGAALRGESEPIRRYGVLLDDATLRQKAFEMGLISTTKNALTPQQRVLAAHAEILDQTTDAQGDFERTSGGMANTQRALAAQMENVTIELGEKLMPVMLSAATWLNTTFIPTLEFIVENLEEFGKAATSLLGPVGDLMDLTSGVGDPLREFAAAIEESGRSADEAQVMVDNFAAATNRSSTEVGDSLMALVGQGRTFEEAWAEIGGNVVVSWGEDARETARLAGQAREGVAGALEGTAEAIGGPFEAGGDAAVDAVEQMYTSIGQEMAARESALAQAGGDAIAAWFQPAEIATQRQQLTGELTESNAEIAELTRSGTNAALAEAKARRLGVVRELMELELAAASIGTHMEQAAALSAIQEGQAHINGLNSADPGIAEAYAEYDRLLTESINFNREQANEAAIGERIATSLERDQRAITDGAETATLGARQHFQAMAVQGEVWGSNTGNAFAAGLASGQSAVIASANLLGYAAGRILGVQSEPDDPNSPLHGITKWGGNIAQTIAEGILGELGAARFASNALATALVPSMAGGYGLDSASRLAGSVGEGGTTIQYILNVEGKPKVVSSRDELWDAFEQEERF